MVIALSSVTATEEPIDRDAALVQGLTDIRAQYQVPSDFPAEVLGRGRSKRRAGRSPAMPTGRTALRDARPAASTDLDQAFAIERDGADLILHYAIADVAWFVAADGALDREAWRRGTTIYLPDGKASLYPAVLSEGAASLLPDVERPAVVFTVRIDRAGSRRSTARCGRSSGRAPSSPTKPSDRDDLPRRLHRAVEPDRAGGGCPRRRARRRAASRSLAEDATAISTLELPAAARGGDAERVAVAGGQPRHRRRASGAPHRAVPGDAGARRACGQAPAPFRQGARPNLAAGSDAAQAASSKASTRQTPATPRSRPQSAALGPRHPTRHTKPASSRGIRQWPRPMPMRRRRCGGWPTAM